jgi:hypothetical protein
MAHKKINFGLRSIKTNQFATIDDVFHDGDEVGLETGFQFGLNDENRILSVQLSVKFHCDNNPFIILKVACDFQIDESSFKKFRDKETNKIKIEKGFITHMMVITVGTARGVLHAKLDGTEFDQFLLPTIDVSQIVVEDVEFD